MPPSTSTIRPASPVFELRTKARRLVREHKVKAIHDRLPPVDECQRHEFREPGAGGKHDIPIPSRGWRRSSTFPLSHCHSLIERWRHGKEPKGNGRNWPTCVNRALLSRMPISSVLFTAPSIIGSRRTSKVTRSWVSPRSSWRSIGMAPRV